MLGSRSVMLLDDHQQPDMTGQHMQLESSHPGIGSTDRHLLGMWPESDLLFDDLRVSSCAGWNPSRPPRPGSAECAHQQLQSMPCVAHSPAASVLVMAQQQRSTRRRQLQSSWAGVCAMQPGTQLDAHVSHCRSSCVKGTRTAALQATRIGGNLLSYIGTLI